MTSEEMFEVHRLRNESVQLRAALSRARTILENMAAERVNPWRRWVVHHEPLRADAKALLPIINAILPTPPKQERDA
jgi:hypothetical protein